MEIREIVARELSCILLPSFPGSAQLSVACILDTRCVFLSLLAVRYNQLHLCYHLQKSSATSCISVITSRCPVQPDASLLSLPDVQCNQLHLLSLPDVGWNLMDPFFNSQKFSAARCRCLHGVTSRICDSTCQWLPIHSLQCGNQWQTECLPLKSVPAKHQMSGATRSSLKCCMMFMVLYTSRSTIYSWYLTMHITLLLHYTHPVITFLLRFPTVIHRSTVYFHWIWHFWAMHQ